MDEFGGTVLQGFFSSPVARRKHPLSSLCCAAVGSLSGPFSHVHSLRRLPTQGPQQEIGTPSAYVLCNSDHPHKPDPMFRSFAILCPALYENPLNRLKYFDCSGTQSSPALQAHIASTLRFTRTLSTPPPLQSKLSAPSALVDRRWTWIVESWRQRYCLGRAAVKG